MNENEEEKYLIIEPQKGSVFPEKGSVFPEKGTLGPDAQIVVNQKSGNIIMIGNPREIKEWLEGLESQRARGAHPKYKLENLKIESGILLPGLVDTHTHPILYSTLGAVEPLYLREIKEGEKLIATLKKRYQKNREPILGLGWDTVALKDLSQEDLNEVSNKVPIIVIDPSFHGGVVNSKGMEILRQLADTYKKEYNVKLRGELSSKGRITEDFVILALSFFESRVTIEEISESTVRWLERELNHGVTDVHDMYIATPFQLAAAMGAIEKWEERYRGQEFPITRFFVKPDILKLLEQRSAELAEVLDKFISLIEKGMVGVKLMADGSIGSYTAELSSAYADKDTQGIQLDTIKKAREAFHLAKKAGISEIAVHAIGDQAIRRAIEFAQYWIRGGEKKKFRIEHYEISGISHILEETKRAGIWVSSQPNYVGDIISYERRLGKDRIRIICPHQSIVKHGIPMMFGTDGMPQNMLFAIWCAVHHPNSRERLSLEEAIIAAAAMAGDWEESKRGRFTEGAPADFVVIDPKVLEAKLSEKDIRLILGSNERIDDLIRQLDEGVWMVIKSGKIVKALKK